MLTKCVECKFYVRQTDEFCLNCGFHNPALKFQNGKFNLKRFALIEVVVLTICFSLAVTITPISQFKAVYIFICLLFSLYVALSVTFIFGTIKDKENYTARKAANKDNLIERGKTIQKRAGELTNRGDKIDAILDRIKETDSSQLQEVRLKLLAAREIVVSHFARYELQARKIELVRLQNDVLPYLFGLHRLNDLETENGLVAIEISQEEIKRMRQNLTRFDSIEFPEKVLPEKEMFLSQLEETENSCEKLREAILSRQATRALQEISPIEENLKFPASKDLAHATETFNISAMLTDFGESFEELEREYRRLRAESEIKLTEN